MCENGYNYDVYKSPVRWFRLYKNRALMIQCAVISLTTKETTRRQAKMAAPILQRAQFQHHAGGQRHTGGEQAQLHTFE